MLKRSFLEFHAQKAAPEAVKALARGQAALAALRSAPWPLSGDGGVSREDVGQYVAVSAQVDALTRKLQVRDSKPFACWTSYHNLNSRVLAPSPFPEPCTTQIRCGSVAEPAAPTVWFVTHLAVVAAGRHHGDPRRADSTGPRPPAAAGRSRHRAAAAGGPAQQPHPSVAEASTLQHLISLSIPFVHSFGLTKFLFEPTRVRIHLCTYTVPTFVIERRAEHVRVMVCPPQGRGFSSGGGLPGTGAASAPPAGRARSWCSSRCETAA